MDTIIALYSFYYMTHTYTHTLTVQSDIMWSTHICHIHKVSDENSNMRSPQTLRANAVAHAITFTHNVKIDR